MRLARVERGHVHLTVSVISPLHFSFRLPLYSSLHLSLSLSLSPVLFAFVPSLHSQANVNARGGSHQRTALHYASLNNHVAIATILLEAGANEFARDMSGYTPLNLCMGGDMCKLLHKVHVATGQQI